MKALSFCANGDGNPVCPPSKVICRQCMDKITSNLENMLGELRRQDTMEGVETQPLTQQGQNTGSAVGSKNL